MADFLSDMNALTQSVGNAANSITNLYNVRKDLETKRIASQVQAKQYDIMKRVNLPLGDPARISFSQDGGGTYFRDVLDQYDKETQELVGSSKWESVRGAVSSTLQPMTQDFSLKIADAYAAQEVEKAQVDWTVALDNELAIAGSLDEVEKIKANAIAYQTQMELFNPAKFQAVITSRFDSASAGLLYKEALTRPSVAAVEGKSAKPVSDNTDPMARTGGVEAVAEQPANKASALSFVAESKASPAAKKMASESIESYSKQQTADFKEWWKLNVTDAKDDGNAQVEAGRQAIANAGFVDKSVVSGAATELQGYEWKQNEAGVNAILDSFYERFTDAGRDSLIPDAQKMVNEYVKSKPSGWSESAQGQAFIKQTSKEIASWEMKDEEGNDIASFGMQLYDLKRAFDIGSGFSLPLLTVKADNLAREVWKKAVETNDYSGAMSMLNQIESVTAGINAKIKETYGLAGEFNISSQENATNQFLGSLDQKTQDIVRKEVKRSQEYGTPLDPQVSKFLSEANDYTVATMTNIGKMSEKDRDSAMQQYRLRIADMGRKAILGQGKPDEKGIVSTDIDKATQTLQKLDGQDLAATNAMTGESAEGSSVQRASIDLLTARGYQFLSGIGAKSITPIESNSANKQFKVEKTGQGGKVSTITYTLKTNTSGGKVRPVLVGSDNSILFIDGKLTPEQQKAVDKQLAEKAANASIVNMWEQ